MAWCRRVLLRVRSQECGQFFQAAPDYKLRRLAAAEQSGLLRLLAAIFSVVRGRRGCRHTGTVVAQAGEAGAVAANVAPSSASSGGGIPVLWGELSTPALHRARRGTASACCPAACRLAEPLQPIAVNFIQHHSFSNLFAKQHVGL